MFVFDVAEADVQDIVKTVSDSLYDGNLIIAAIEDKTNKNGWRTTFTVTVKSNDGKGSKNNPTNGRKIRACCWHGYRDVLAELFSRHPKARVKTMLADYHGQDDFFNKFPATGNKVIDPQSKSKMKEYCHCER